MARAPLRTNQDQVNQEKNIPAIAEPEKDVLLDKPKESLLSLLSINCKGLTLSEISAELGVFPIITYHATRNLLQQHMIIKRGNLYFPINRSKKR